MLAKNLQGAAAAVQPAYVEDVFSTWLYTGTGATQTITNGPDLSGKGGMVWIKGRSGATGHRLTDTARGATKSLASNDTAAEATESTGLTAFGSTGFTIGADADYNTNTATYVSWTFREQAKFFDVVTYTGTGSQQSINHSLGSTPGCIIVKRTDTTSSYWGVYHRSLTDTYGLGLNTTDAQFAAPSYFVNSASQTSTQFTVGTSANVNASGGTYVAYLFAHNAGGFGASGSDNVISCGSFTTTTSGNYRTELGYEPQFLLVKRSAGGVSSWWMFDTMRGFNVGGNDAYLESNSSSAELNSFDFGSPDATGFTLNGLSGSSTYIYIAIRRGPMKTPTSGTSVFTPAVRTGTGTTTQITNVGFPPDLVFNKDRRTGSFDSFLGFTWFDRLRGAGVVLRSNTTGVDVTDKTAFSAFGQSGISVGADSNGYINANGEDLVNFYLRRAPGFFDVVCYTGTGASATLSHNLTVAPELVIIKGRSVVSNWETYLSLLGGTSGNGLAINDNGAKSGTPPVSSVTATTFTLNNGVSTTNGQTYVAYLFATVAGVSKVGSYTGTGTTQQINCGFTGGARFILIKRTNSTGDWYVWDSARGIVAGNDPYLLLNTDDAEVTNTDYIDTYSAGFEISSTAPAAINANGGTFIFLAIA